ncbi:sodium:proton antiporter [Nocardioides sp. GY 10113]|uniref:cation:proton antiporter n=1 Tax=Nocardioides sp. GY 10113 TaxID=2569761 RepID=UPI0010A8C9D4|nr:cation:proton antiporter [Nocardioides sp. GY 10113]TIC88453.1 sodium:proton antiporter [Nocardioides sp. GY 10113]
MTATAIAVLSALVAAWALMSGALSRHNVTGPMVFVAAGYLLGNPDWGPMGVDVATESARVIAEVTLALLLFADASRIDPEQLRHTAAVPARLLGVGLPLAMIAGTAAAVVLVADLPWVLALFVGAALAPTDAALSAAVITDERVPLRLRRSLNVESGLNDGIATPVVSMALAASAAVFGLSGGAESVAVVDALRELGLGVLAGALVGGVGAWATDRALRRGWASADARAMAVLALAVVAYASALASGGNGFIAAFVAGLAFSGVSARDAADDGAVVLPELGGELLALVVWFLFGAGLVPIIVTNIDLAAVTFAVLALTVLRMVPVGIALIGSGLSRRDVLFLGWFGPRGLASVVFALLAVEALAESEHPLAAWAVAAIAFTVLLSVVLHGLSAGPAARRFGTPEGRPPEVGPAPTARRQRLVAADAVRRRGGDGGR